MATAELAFSTKTTLIAKKQIDPIFAAIEKHRKALIAWMPHLSRESNAVGEEGRAASDAATPYLNAVEQALEKLGRTIPTTFAGVLAVLEYIDDVNCDRVLASEDRFHDGNGPLATNYQEWPDWERERDDVPAHSNGHRCGDTWTLKVMRNIHTALVNLKTIEIRGEA